MGKHVESLASYDRAIAHSIGLLQVNFMVDKSKVLLDLERMPEAKGLLEQAKRTLQKYPDAPGFESVDRCIEDVLHGRCK